MSVSQSGQLGLEAGILERVEGREVEEEIFGIHPLGMGSERIGRPKQIVCDRAGHETGGGGGIWRSRRPVPTCSLTGSGLGQQASLLG